MSDPVIRRVRRSIEEAKNRGGMQVGMPKVTIDAGDAERLCIVAEALATVEAENEALRERLENYEALKRMHRLDNYPNELSAKAWLLRKQAEAVEVIADKLEGMNLMRPDEFLRSSAQRLRQQAKELEKSNAKQ